MEPFKIIQQHYQNRDLAAREWRKNGGKVVGYFDDRVPEELIVAAGMLPVRLAGDPNGGTETADKYSESFYEGSVRSMFNLLLSGKYDYVDYLVFPHSRDTVVAMYGMLLQVLELEPHLSVPEFYFFELLHSRYYASQLYNRDSLLEFKKKLETWSGVEITNEALNQAISVCTENRRLLQLLAKARATKLPGVSGTQALQIIGSAMVMPKPEHSQLLKSLLETSLETPKLAGPCFFVSGSPLDHLQFYQVVESCGATIIGEDNMWGNNYAETLVQPSDDPLEAVLERYQTMAPSTVDYPMSLRKDYVVEKALASGANGVVFCLHEWDYAQTWDHPEIKKSLDAHNIPSITFRGQHYSLSSSERGQIKSVVEGFIKRIQRASVR